MININSYFPMGGSGSTPSRETLATEHIHNDNAGENIKQGQPLCLSSGDLFLAKGVNNYNIVAGLAYEDADLGEDCKYQMSGEFILADWTNVIGTQYLTPETFYYLDTENFGKLTSVLPETSGVYQVQYGYALDTTTLDIVNTYNILL